MLEIKQGPFNLAMDKERFDKVNEKYESMIDISYIDKLKEKKSIQ